MDRSQRITGARKALRDYQQYLKSPVPGTKIFPMEWNINEYHVNTKVPDGTYKDIVIHWILTIPDKYPFKAPFGELPPGIMIKHENIHYEGFCNNFLQNFDYMNQMSGSFDGWTPGCSFESLMLAMKCFFDDNERFRYYNPETARNEALRIFEGYQCKSCGSQGEVFEENVAIETETDLTCQVSHLSFKDDPQMILGYPINITFRSSNYNETDILKIRLPDIELFPEMISYESYTTALSFKLSGETHNMRTPLGQEYNNWIPIYLNDRHYEVSKKYIYTILSTICYGEGGSDSDYRPLMFMKVYPAILNGIVVAISKCKSYESDALILAFTNVLKTFLQAILVENLEGENSRIVERFILQNRRSKRDTPNLGEWLFNLAASDKFKLEDSVPIVLKEMFPRMCFWINKEAQNPFQLPMTPANHEEIKRRFFRCGQVSLRLFLFNVICLKEHLELILENGTLPQEKLVVMRERIKEIKNVDSLAQFYKLVGDEGNEIERINFAISYAKKCRYF